MLLLIDKPKGITSHDVIYQLRKITGIRKIGHAGTLDPNATGLLIVGVGRESTKKLGHLATNTKKEYVADIVLGEQRTTDDVEGEVLHSNEVLKPKVGMVNEVLLNFTGRIEQTPPSYSAIKIKGKKAYELARRGKEIKLQKRSVTVYSIKLLEYKYPLVKLKLLVSSGTYIRSLARDIGLKLGTYAYLHDLRRTKIADYKVDKAVRLNKLKTENWEKFGIIET